jgi:hypothetical protein
MTDSTHRAAIIIPHWFAIVIAGGFAVFVFIATALVIPWAQQMTATVQATQIDVATLKTKLDRFPDLSAGELHALRTTIETNRQEIGRLTQEVARIKATRGP